MVHRASSRAATREDLISKIRIRSKFSISYHLFCRLGDNRWSRKKRGCSLTTPYGQMYHHDYHRAGTHLTPLGTSIRVTAPTFSAARGVALRKERDDSSWELLQSLDRQTALASSGTAPTLTAPSTRIVIQEDKHIFDAVRERATSPFHLVEEQLILKRARDLECDATIVGGDPQGDQKLSLDDRLDG